MHGVKRVPKDQIDQAKEKAKLIKAKKYHEGSLAVLKMRKAKKYDAESLGHTEKLLEVNPEFSTMWNFRREIITELFKTDEEIGEALKVELELTERGIAKNPKVYCIWHHREWVIKHPGIDLKRELALCDKLLNMDERNFHCYKYRMAVVKALGVTPEEDLKFTMKKINQNFSNYSAWHLRSVLLPKLYKLGDPIWDEELDLVQQAAFTEPTDQSGWLYHRWLLGRAENEISVASSHPADGSDVTSLDNGKIRVSFTHRVKGVSSETVSVRICGNEEVTVDGSWEAASSALYNSSWYFNPSSSFMVDAQGKYVKISISGDVTTKMGDRISDTGFAFSVGATLSALESRCGWLGKDLVFSSTKAVPLSQMAQFTVSKDGAAMVGSWVPGVCLHATKLGTVDGEHFVVNQPSGQVCRAKLDDVATRHWAFVPAEPLKQTADVVVAADSLGIEVNIKADQQSETPWMQRRTVEAGDNVLLQEVEGCRELLDLEPDTKWPMLTLALLLNEVDGDHDEVLSILDKLCAIDEMRKEYYKDLRSKIVFEYAAKLRLPVLTLVEKGNPEVDFSGLHLTTISHGPYMAGVRRVDLSNNDLRNLDGIQEWTELEELIIDGNKRITSVAALQQLPNLRKLSVRGLQVADIASLASSVTVVSS